MTEFNIPENRNDDLKAWLEYGKQQGWIVPNVVCQTHAPMPMTDEEIQEYDDGGDPCIHVIRIFESETEQKKALKNWE